MRGDRHFAHAIVAALVAMAAFALVLFVGNRQHAKRG
jgi:hypothetical protein